MGHETEIKLKIKDVAAFRARLAKMGARLVFGGTGRVHEWNVLFDTPEQTFKRRWELLRIRTETADGARATKKKHVLVTYKRPVRSGKGIARGEKRRHKVREEIELEVGDGAALTRIFEGAGLKAWFRYEKFRTTYRLKKSQEWAAGLLIELDETPIGTFVELEGPAKAIDRAAEELGFSERDYIVGNYFSLYRMECEQRKAKIGDMTFRKHRTKLRNG